MANKRQPRILVIKLSALGDFILSTGPFKAIRNHHPTAQITLLTTAPFVSLARTTEYFNNVVIDPRPRIFDIPGWLQIRRFVRSQRWDRIYDLQHNDRTNAYYRFLSKPKPQWSGIAKGCSHPHTNPYRNQMHTLDREAEQLKIAGIVDTPPIDLSFLTDDISNFELPQRIALLVPGGAPHRMEKRWPAANYAKLASYLCAHRIVPVVIGGAAESSAIKTICEKEPLTINLAQRTSLGHVAELARKARFAVGNDTGPMHVIAATQCPSFILFSGASLPSQTAPRGQHVVVKQVKDLDTLLWDSVSEDIIEFVSFYDHESEKEELL